MFAILLLCCTGFVAGAQENVYPPKALFIKLNTKKAAIAHLQQNSSQARAALLQQENDTLNARLMRDWKDHFNYCPVYFFADTNLSLVMDGSYESVVFDTAHQQISPEQIKQIGNRFYIAYLGVRSQEDYNATSSVPGSTQLPSLIVCDATFKILDSYQLSSSMNADLVSFLFPRRGEKDYRFRSRYFNLDYFPVAEKYEKKLRKYWNQ